MLVFDEADQAVADRRGAGFEDEIDDIDGVADVAGFVTVGVPHFQRTGGRAGLEDIIDDRNRITDVNRPVAVGIAAKQ